LWEVFNALTTRPATAILLRQATGDRRPMPAAQVDLIWRHLDRGTKRAILALYRSAGPSELAAAGAHLERLECPALVVWGDRDPYLPPRFGQAYAERFPRGELLTIHGAGHWPWIDRPRIVDQIAQYLDSS
jgi:pimeloyl-ACP methyl ester carboxylesterase